MTKSDEALGPDGWARLRFAIVGPLLVAPPKRGALRRELERLAATPWRHPVTDEPLCFSMPTIERWYYLARNAPRDPLGALCRAVRRDAGTHPSMPLKLQALLHRQYEEHPGWSYKLHTRNLRVLVENRPELGPMPSYTTVRRYMRAAGLHKHKRVASAKTAGERRAAARLQQREVRSYEVEHVHGLWHCDFHSGSLKVLTEGGVYRTPILFAVLDDCSRLCCHAQWYLNETAETFVHGLSQAILKRGLPRGLMSDNGSAMIAAETQAGLMTLSIVHFTTLTQSPYQNGKQESWWENVDNNPLAMLENVPRLSLAGLNEATQAWVELGYHRTAHSSLACGLTPLQRYLDGPDVGRPSPSVAEIKSAFRLDTWRTQRQSDGTVSIEGRRFEVPNQYRHMRRLLVRYARWDLSFVHMVDAGTSRELCRLYPLDKRANADRRRRALQPAGSPPTPAVQRDGEVAPLLVRLIEEYRASGLPPAYLPKHDKETSQ
jgi:transposase InsO family protein